MIGKLVSRPWCNSNSHTVTSPLTRLATVTRDEKFADNLRRIRERYGMDRKGNRAFSPGDFGGHGR